MGIMRIGHIHLKVMDVTAAIFHYTKVLGMKEVDRDSSGNVYLKAWDEWDKYSVVLCPSEEAGVASVAFKVEHDSDLDILHQRILNYGSEVQWREAGYLKDVGRCLEFFLPSGHLMHLYASKVVLGKDVGVNNPDPWPDTLTGIGVHWLDHCLLVCELDPARGINKVEENIKFVTEVLGFYISEKVVVGPERNITAAVWLFRSSTPHDLAFVGGPRKGLHHVAFFLDDWADILKSADILAKNRVSVDVTPQRHGITRGTTTYFFDPSGNRNETFAGLGYLAQPDMPTIIWDEEHLWRGIFYHSGTESGEFTSAYT